MADFAAGLRGLSTAQMFIAKKATEYSSYGVLRQLRNYVVEHNSKFKSHRLGYSGRPGKPCEVRITPIIIKLLILTIKVADPIPKDEPREQQKVELSVFEPKTVTIARNTHIA